MIKSKVTVDKTYKLTSSSTPLAYFIPTRNSTSYSLLYYDEEKNENRALRYAKNQKSPFEDEQDGNTILEAVVFEDGFLSVPRSNPVLQEFLHYHPMNGKEFVEVNSEKDAEADLEALNIQADALVAAKSLSIEELENISRVVFGTDPSRYSTAELKRDILLLARNNPEVFLDALSDPSTNLKSQIQGFFEKGLISFRKNKKEVWFNTVSNKSRMLAIPYKEDPIDAIASYLQSDAGIESLKMLENLAEG